MSCEECKQLLDLRTRAHWACLEHIGNDPREGQTKKTQTNPERELQDAYDATAAEYKNHVATAHTFPPPNAKRHPRSSEEMKSDVLQLNDGDKNMLGIIASILIVIWLLGFFAFHVTGALIHVALVLGLIAWIPMGALISVLRINKPFIASSWPATPYQSPPTSPHRRG